MTSLPQHLLALYKGQSAFLLQHIIRHSFAEREAGSWLPTETAQTRSRSQQLSPEKAECPLPRTESAARRTPQRSQGPEPTPSRGERCATGRLAVAVCRSCAFSDVWRWQDIDAMRSQVPGDGGICAKCVPGRSTMAKCSQNAFPGIRRWQDCALMRSWPDWQWQYSRAMRSRGLAVARFRRGAFPGGNPWQVFRPMHPESGLGRENRQFVARFARHASKTSWLWQDVRAMYPKCPANRRRRIHRANILPGRGPFRCTGPSNHARRANLAIVRRMKGKDQAENAYVL